MSRALGYLGRQHKRVQPVVRRGAASLAKTATPSAPERRRCSAAPARVSAQAGAELRQLCHAERGVEVRHAVVVANLVVAKRPLVRHLGRRAQVLCVLCHVRIVGDYCAAATGGQDLVAVEAQRRHAG